MKLRLMTTVTVLSVIGIVSTTVMAAENLIFEDTFTSTTSTAITSHTPDLSHANSAWKQVPAGADWMVVDGNARELSVTTADNFAYIDATEPNIIIEADIQWTAGKIGLVLRAQDSPLNDGVFVWFDGGSSTINIASYNNGIFNLIDVVSYTWTAGEYRHWKVTDLNGNLKLEIDGVQILSLNNTVHKGNTYVGLFENGSSTIATNVNNFRVNVIVADPEPDQIEVDFLPFVYGFGMLAGLILVGYGETHRTGQYIMAGALLFVASTIPTGIAWLIVLSALAFIPAMYRGYIHITTANNQGRIE